MKKTDPAPDPDCDQNTPDNNNNNNNNTNFVCLSNNNKTNGNFTKSDLIRSNTGSFGHVASLNNKESIVNEETEYYAINKYYIMSSIVYLLLETVRTVAQNKSSLQQQQ